MPVLTQPLEIRPLLDRLLLANMSAWRLGIVGAALPGVAVWLLVSPDWMISREWTWDLLFNLAGAWHLAEGHSAHVDFHDPLGVLGFQLTRVGMWIAGPSVRAFLLGQLIALAVLFAAAVYAASRRLAGLPATMFVWYATLLVLLPLNLGDLVNAYSFAMSYNRWGWSALTSLFVLLFIEPRRPGRMMWLDPAVSGLLILFLFYVKFTYAAAGIAAVAFAVGTMPHVRQSWRHWIAMLGALLLIAALPSNHAYLADIRYALTSGYARTSLSHLITFLDNRHELVLRMIGIWALLWLWTRQVVRFQAVVAGVVILALGMFVLSQNAQVRDMPVGVVIWLMVYAGICRGQQSAGPLPSSGLALVLTASLLSLSLTLVSHTATMVGYYRAATRTSETLRVSTTNLRGLAVPTDAAHGYPSHVAPHEFLSPTRPLPSRDQVTQQQYVESLLEAAAFLHSSGEGGARVLTLDQVNPMPFILGAPSPRGGGLWLWPETPPRPAESVFGDVDVVLVPKYATDASSTLFALNTYAGYLTVQFPVRLDTPRWTIFKRVGTTAPRPAIR